MPYRPAQAEVELSVGTVVTAVVPAAIRAAFIGSVVMAVIMTGVVAIEALSYRDWSPGLLFETVLLVVWSFFLFTFIATLVSVAFCGFYLAAVGIPVALVLGRRLDTRKGLVGALASALVAAFVASRLLDGGPLDTLPDNGWLFAVACAYAFPAAIYFRRDIILAREMSPWAED